jgi:hypothetical protein
MVNVTARRLLLLLDPRSRNKTTIAAEALLDGEAEIITRKAIERAISGDPTALRPCLELILPARKDRPVRFELPQIKSLADAVAASAALLTAVAAGDLTPSEAADISKKSTPSGIVSMSVKTFSGGRSCVKAAYIMRAWYRLSSRQ